MPLIADLKYEAGSRREMGGGREETKRRKGIQLNCPNRCAITSLIGLIASRDYYSIFIKILRA